MTPRLHLDGGAVRWQGYKGGVARPNRGGVMRYPSYAAEGGTTFPQLRTVVRPDLAELSDAELSDVIGGQLGVDAAAMEDFLSGLKQFGSAVLQRLPQIGLGAVTGFATGGPIGAVIGGVGGGLAGGGPGGAAPGRQGVPAIAQPRPMPAPIGGAPATFAALLANPMLQQALMQLIMGRAANSHVTTPTGQRVPNEAFVELIREAADQVLAEQEALGAGEASENLPDYLVDAEQARRRSMSDDPALRAAVLFRLLEPPNRYVPVPTAPTTTVVTGPPGTVAASPATGVPPAGAPAAVQPIVGGEPFVSYTPPELGGAGPTVYGLDERYQDETEEAWAEWAFDQSLDDILGSVESG
jgi:hypothetical protein